jgi:hypothetical protein
MFTVSQRWRHRGAQRLADFRQPAAQDDDLGLICARRLVGGFIDYRGLSAEWGIVAGHHCHGRGQRLDDQDLCAV